MQSFAPRAEAVVEPTGISHDYINHLMSALGPLQILSYCEPGDAEVKATVADLLAALRGLKSYQRYMEEDILPTVCADGAELLRSSFLNHTAVPPEERRLARLDALVAQLRRSGDLLEAGRFDCRAALACIGEACELITGDTAMLERVLAQCNVDRIAKCLAGSTPRSGSAAAS